MAKKFVMVPETTWNQINKTLSLLGQSVASVDIGTQAEFDIARAEKAEAAPAKKAAAPAAKVAKVAKEPAAPKAPKTDNGLPPIFTPEGYTSKWLRDLYKEWRANPNVKVVNDKKVDAAALDAMKVHIESVNANSAARTRQRRLDGKLPSGGSGKVKAAPAPAPVAKPAAKVAVKAAEAKPAAKVAAKQAAQAARPAAKVAAKTAAKTADAFSSW